MDDHLSRTRYTKYLQPNQGRIQDFPLGGGAPTLVGGGANLRHRHFSVKTYVKTKEFGPVGGGGAHRKLLYVDPPLLMDFSMEVSQPLMRKY